VYALEYILNLGRGKMEHMLFSKEDLKKLIIPLVMEQALAISIGLFDTLMVSSCGEAAVSGVSLVDSISILLVQVMAALATGGAVVCSQYLGKGKEGEAKRSAGQLIFIMTTVSLAVMIFALIFYRYLLQWIFGRIDADVMHNAEIYFVISACSYPFLGVYNAGAALFRSIGNSKISMYTSLVMNLMNISGNALFIFVFRWGVFGAAIATLIARIGAALYMTVLLCHKDHPLCIATRETLHPNYGIIKKILQIGIPSGIENGMFQVGKLLVSSLTATFGTASIAANAVGNSIAGVSNIMGSAIGLSMVTVIGRCIGAGEKEQARYYGKKLMKLAYIGMACCQLTLFLVQKPLLHCFGLSQQAFTIGVQLMSTYAVSAACIWPLSFTMPNLLRAAGDARYTMVVSVFSMWFFRILSSYFFALTLKLGVLGVWTAMYVDWAFRALLYTYRYRSGKWLEKKLV